jgi:hypothetical protein
MFFFVVFVCVCVLLQCREIKGIQFYLIREISKMVFVLQGILSATFMF